MAIYNNIHKFIEKVRKVEVGKDGKNLIIFIIIVNFVYFLCSQLSDNFFVNFKCSAFSGELWLFRFLAISWFERRRRNSDFFFAFISFLLEDFVASHESAMLCKYSQKIIHFCHGKKNVKESVKSWWGAGKKMFDFVFA